MRLRYNVLSSLLKYTGKRMEKQVCKYGKNGKRGAGGGEKKPPENALFSGGRRSCVCDGRYFSCSSIRREAISTAACT